MQQPQHLRGHDQYTVGWIAALDCELTAAISMLDGQHEQPHDFQRGPNDDNVYVWGEINKHNIVIACLKAGVYGTTSAATTAMRLLSAFPNVKFGLMVGIGAGVPQHGNKPDIRLGDVVVSEPDGSTGGVYLYDLVKAKSGGVSEPKGFLNAPPGILLKSLTRLRAEHKLKGMDIQRHLEKITPNMAEPDDDTPGFVYQGTENDRLFKADSLHVDGDDCESCIATEQVKRKERKNPTRPMFHYGIIASGNTLVKDAMHREELTQRIPGRCLCLEMEAAGLMNDFPCLVIRGICDYADTHKNEQWQPYAAVTAAAYARELLHFVPREEVEKAVKATEVMQGISRVLEANHKTTKDTNQRGKQAEIKKWLSPVDPESNLATARSQCYKNTGQWFLHGQVFSRWKEQPGSFLWICGRPGCGKTILSSIIIDHLRLVKHSSTPKSTVLFYYFDFKDISKRSKSNFIRSLLLQLSAASDNSWKKLEELHDFHRGISQPLDSDLIKAFQSISAEFDRIMIILDALDEAMDSEKTDLIQTIIQIISTPSARIHLIATSRSEQGIENALQQAEPVVVDLTKGAINEDIKRYIRGRIRDPKNHSNLQERWKSRPNILEEIETTLIEKADGMFRWASCQLDAIEDCLDLRTLRNTLKDLPATLDETYERILRKMTPNKRKSAVKLLQLLAFSERPLSVGQAVDAYAVDPSESPSFSKEYRLPVPLEIVQICSSLVTFGETRKLRGVEDRILHLAHFSVKEYITSTRLQPEDLRGQFDLVRAHSSIAKICIGYITSVLAEGNPYFPDFVTLYGKFPFLEYASTYWTTHAKGGDDDEKLFDTILNFFQHPAYQTWGTYFLFDNFRYVRIRWVPPPIHVCIYSKLAKTTLKLMDYPEYSEPQFLCDGIDSWERKQLIRHYRFIYHDSEKDSFASLLYVASFVGDQTILRHLIDQGAPVHKRYGHLGTALDIACMKLNTENIEILLSYGSVPAEKYPEYIQSAMKTLMEYPDGFGPFLKPKQNYPSIMSRFLAVCEQMNTRTTCLDTALLGALNILDFATAQTLITKGASFMEVAKHIQMLEHLPSHGLCEIRELLRKNQMEHAIFRSIRELEEEGHEWGDEPREILSRCPNEEIFALVLGLPLSTCDDVSKPLRPDPMHREVLRNGGRPCQSFTTTKFGYRTPLMSWAIEGRADLVELLLRGGADIDEIDRHGNTASHYAAIHERWEVLDVLARYEADIGIRNDHGQLQSTTTVRPRRRTRVMDVVRTWWSRS